MGPSTRTTNDAAPLPADLQELIDEFLAIEDDAERLVGPLDDEQFNWSPGRGAWSIGQCIHHLNLTNRKYFEALSAAVARAQADGVTRTGPIVSSWIGRRFVAMLEPPVSVRKKNRKRI